MKHYMKKNHVIVCIVRFQFYLKNKNYIPVYKDICVFKNCLKRNSCVYSTADPTVDDISVIGDL